ncbi:MAG: hypothetical protein OQL06_15595 [Gammaproteobacteria bacterium]|nr:hypothetical protein [Gammaproteobacteria bacterium]
METQRLDDSVSVRYLKKDQEGAELVQYLRLESTDRDDEISLFDLWLVLVNRKVLLFTVAGVILLLGILQALTIPSKYQYHTAIEIGMTRNSEGPVYFEDPGTVLSKINKSYIPQVMAETMALNPGFNSLNKIKASLEKNSHVIFLEVKSVEKDEEIYIGMLKQIVALIEADHGRISAIWEKDLELSKSKVEHGIIRLQDQEKLFHAQNKRIDEKAQLLLQRINDVRQSLAESIKTRQSAAKKVNTEGKALALLMMDNDLRSSREQLAGLEEKHSLGIQNSREILANQIAENQRKQLEAKYELSRIEIERKNLLHTRALSRPIKHNDPVGPSKKLIVIGALFAGIFMAVFAVFIAEFLSKARDYANKQA